MSAPTELPSPRVGIGIMIFKEGKILIGKRLASHGTGDYAFPGGHLENGESFEVCALREIAEECGADFKVKNLRFCLVANVKAFMPKHYVQVGFMADWASGEPLNTEPEKLESWGWYAPEALPAPLFNPAEGMIKAWRAGVQYCDE